MTRMDTEDKKEDIIEDNIDNYCADQQRLR